MSFSQIIPPSPSPTESKRLFYASASLLLSRIQGSRYHLSKFHTYALIYCIGVFLTYFTLAQDNTFETGNIENNIASNNSKVISKN